MMQSPHLGLYAASAFAAAGAAAVYTAQQRAQTLKPRRRKAQVLELDRRIDQRLDEQEKRLSQKATTLIERMQAEQTALKSKIASARREIDSLTRRCIVNDAKWEKQDRYDDTVASAVNYNDERLSRRVQVLTQELQSLRAESKRCAEQHSGDDAGDASSADSDGGDDDGGDSRASGYDHSAIRPGDGDPS